MFWIIKYIDPQKQLEEREEMQVGSDLELENDEIGLLTSNLFV